MNSITVLRDSFVVPLERVSLNNFLTMFVDPVFQDVLGFSARRENIASSKNFMVTSAFVYLDIQECSAKQVTRLQLTFSLERYTPFKHWTLSLGNVENLVV